MFRIELLSAANGDAVWIEYGDAKAPRRIVIDGGPAVSYEQGLRARILKLAETKRRIDLFIISHIDTDHIDGALILLREAQALKVQFGEVWFNAWDQLNAIAPDILQPIQGEFLAALLKKGGISRSWNARVGGGAIVVPDEGPLPSWTLEDGACLTLLSPGVRQLKRLRARWESAIRDFSPGDTEEALRRLDTRGEYRPPTAPPVFGVHSPGDDRSVANGSSIAFVLEYDGASCLFAADAHPRVVAASLQRLAQERNPGRGGRVTFDAVKVPHHGSVANICEELVTTIDTPLWLISTNGAVSGHPDPETAELIVRFANQRPTFLCNYKSPATIALADESHDRWQTKYPGEGVDPGPTGGMQIDLAKPRPATRARTPSPRGAAVRRRGPASRRSTHA